VAEQGDRTDVTAAVEGRHDEVPAVFTRALLERARARNVDVEAIVRAAGFSRELLQREERAVSLPRQQYSRLWLALLRELGDECGGLMPDGSTPPGTSRLIALSMLNSSDLGTAMRRAMEFNACCRLEPGSRVINRLEVDAASREATLVYLCRDVPPADQFRILCHLAMWLRFCGWLVGQQIDVIRANCAGPGDAPAVRDFFRCPVHDSQPVTAVTFSARHLEARPIRSEAELADFLAQAPGLVVAEPRVTAHSITHRIREILGEDFRREMPSFEALTGLLNMSARTLRRRLEKEGTSYQRIKDNARRDLAIGLLRREGLTVSDVAERVGFSDPSSFHRSFRRWTGLAPGAYR
jgi:AraC-like DNA-binding protein